MSLIPPLPIPPIYQNQAIITTNSNNNHHSISHNIRSMNNINNNHPHYPPIIATNPIIESKPLHSDNDIDDDMNNEEEEESTEDDDDENETIIKRKYVKKKRTRCAALDYLSDSPKKKRGRKVKDRKNLPPIQKQPFFLVFPDLRLKCPQCDHIAICQGTLVQHLRTHPTSRKCPTCHKTFSTQQNLIKHARLHTGERPYPCPIAECKWAYKQKGDLLAHIQRGKHGNASDNNRKPPPQKFYHGATKLPTLHAISKEDIAAAPNLKNLILSLRKREEMKKRQKFKTAQRRKNQIDDFVLSMFLSIYDIDNFEMKNLLKIAKQKFGQKKVKKEEAEEKGMQIDTINGNKNNETKMEQNENECVGVDEDKDFNDSFDLLPNGKRVSIKFKYLVNRVYGDYSIVLVPINSVPQNEICESTPEIVIDPALIPQLQSDSNAKDKKKENICAKSPIDECLNTTHSPPNKKQKLNEFESNHIVLANSGSAIGQLRAKRPYHKYNQNAEGFWICDAPNCGSLFLCKDELEFHCTTVHAAGYYGCKFCERIYRSQKNVQNHLKKEHNKHGDEYLNALIYNKFTQMIRLKESKWNQIIQKNEEQNDENCDKMVIKRVIFKTHPFENTILREEHDSEKEGSDCSKRKVLVPWTMCEKNKKSLRGRGRPAKNECFGVDKVIKKRGRPKGSKNKKIKIQRFGDSESESDSDSDSDNDFLYEDGTIYDDIDGENDSFELDSCENEQSILEKELKMEQKLIKKRGKKRKRKEYEECDDNFTQIKKEKSIKSEMESINTNKFLGNLPNMPQFNPLPSSFSDLFNANYPMPALPAPFHQNSNNAHNDLNGILSQLSSQNDNTPNVHSDNMDILSLIGSVLSAPPTSSTQSHSHHQNILSPMHNQMNNVPQQSNFNMNQLNAMSNQLNSIQSSLQLPPLNSLLNKRKSEESIHSKIGIDQSLQNLFGTGPMLNNYGNIVNNNYQILKRRNERKEKSESPFVPPLVDAVCGAVGCCKTQRDDGSQLLMCGRCFLVKYCSKECQLAHIHEHRKVCRKKGSQK